SIRSVSAPSAKRPLVRAAAVVGTERERLAGKVSIGQLDCAPISIVLLERDAGPFYSWVNGFAMKGNANAERPGRLEFLSNTGTVLAAAEFGNLGIVRYAPLPLAGDAARGSVGSAAGLLATVQVDMFCETMTLISA